VIVSLVAGSLLRPRWTGLLIWPVFMMYPHGYWNRIVRMPMNVGFDDLFALFALGWTLLAVQAPTRKRRGISWGVLIMGLHGVMVAMAFTSGYVFAHGWSHGVRSWLLATSVKEALKFWVYFAAVLATMRCIDTPRELRRACLAVFLAMAGGAAILLLCHQFPAIRMIFAHEDDSERVAQGWVSERVAGPFTKVNTAGLVLGLALAYGIYALASWRGAVRVLVIAGMVLVVPALALTQSRTGLGVAVAVLLAGVLCSAVRSWAFGIGAAGLASLLAFPSIFQKVLLRLQNTFTRTTYGMSANTMIGARVYWWSRYLTELDIRTILLGRGSVVPMLEYGQKPHSGYIDLLAWYGFWGVLWFVAFLAGLVPRLVALMKMKAASPELRAFGPLAIMVFVSLGVYAITADMMSPSGLPMLLMLTILGLSDRAYDIACWEPQGVHRPHLPPVDRQLEPKIDRWSSTSTPR
jgi:hypothetical protein